MKQYSLSEFSDEVKKILSSNLERSYWIIAEIGQINFHSNGHCYLELVEKDNNIIKAKSRATIWANTFYQLHEWFISITGSSLKQGMKILVNVSFEYHAVYGISLNIKDIDANFTLGERERKRQETISQLEEEGIFEMNKSHALPDVIQQVAVISSESAAGYEDFINQFETNNYGYHVNFELFQSMMQGHDSPHSIIQNLHKIFEVERKYDAVLIIRGGGSKLDLDCFDDYELCSHLAHFPIPVITGIGHERDQSITDMVAHTRLKTPTSVADFLIARMLEFENNMNEMFGNLKYITQGLIRFNESELIQSKNIIDMNVKQLLTKEMLCLTNINEYINSKPALIIQSKLSIIDNFRRLSEAHNSKNILKKGYSITKVNGKLISDQKIKTGDKMESITYRFTISSTINEIK